MKYDVDGINLKKELKLYRMELDLNEEPLDPTHSSVVEFDSILDELESAHGDIQDRIRHLEAVTSRARQRQRWPSVHSPIQITNFTGGSAADNAQDEGMEHQEVEEGIVESGKGVNGKGSHLIAKALGGVETDACKAGGSTGNLFDCNICFGKARDPVLTCCGHLFCWPCFYQLPYAYSKATECPVCNGEVTETGIIPIYGNASGSSKCQDELKEAGLRVPSRPRAPRIESTRQQLISQGASSSSVIRNIRQFHNLVSGLGEQVQSERPNTATDRNSILLSQSRLRTDSNQHTVSHPVSRLFVQGAASFSSLSSALNSAMDSAERLVEDLESHMHDHQVGGSRQSNPRAVNRNSTFRDAATNLPESLARDVTATNSTAAAYVPPSSRNVDTIAVLGSETTHRRRRRRTEVLRRFSTAPRRRRPR
ncbi:uncharacterized protein LOC133302773 [Gastrolobium bilobum]|uniref:uncharacterized protein LOC133302773 n=1 Tax=Gastrolobium bilobum TaxID=150636 RepID=UPI002AAF26B0|nr:uncharacterized protein LOC133302773 [Gastrolobium bilobum]